MSAKSPALQLRTLEEFVERLREDMQKVRSEEIAQVIDGRANAIEWAIENLKHLVIADRQAMARSLAEMRSSDPFGEAWGHALRHYSAGELAKSVRWVRTAVLAVGGQSKLGCEPLVQLAEKLLRDGSPPYVARQSLIALIVGRNV